MAVLASQRSIAREQYVTHFGKLYGYTEERINKIPKRKKMWLSTPIIETMNRIYNDILSTNNPYYKFELCELDRLEQARYITSNLLSLQKPLLSLWNIEDYKEKSMVAWIEMINEEIYYLGLYGGAKPRKGKNYMFILDKKAINKMDFLKNMCELQKYIYTRVVSSSTSCKEMRGRFLIDLADEAMYRVMKANSRYQKTKADYEERKKNLSIAMNCLNKMQPMMLSFFQIMDYSNSIMKEWCELFDKEMLLLSKVMKSDKERFKNLK